MSELITSPVGNILFMALKQKVRKKPTDTEASVYTIRLEFDGNTAEGKAFREAIAAVNKDLIGTKHASKEGNYTVAASTKFEPKVIDTSGETLEQADVPWFPKGSTGSASVVVKPFLGNKLGGSLNLIAVGLNELDLVEQESGGASDQSYLDELRGKLNAS